MTRSMLIREVETELANTRARAMLKHKGVTYTEYKAEQRRKHRRWGKWAVIGLLLTAATVAAKSCVQ